MIKAIQEQINADIKIKWVNDLILGGRKLGGILIEGSIAPETRAYEYLIAGIGVNLYSTKLDEEIQSTATSLEDETGVKINKATLVKSFVRHFLSVVRQISWQ